MARKELKFTVTDAGRDLGRTFVITEMSARAGHAWATRALFGIMNAGAEIPDNIMSAGLAGLASIGIKALGKLSIEIAAPLLDELLDCVQIMPDPARPGVLRSLVHDDTEEIVTLFRLQKEALALHIEFFTGAGNPTSGPAEMSSAG
jgi:hypothetical protein